MTKKLLKKGGGARLVLENFVSGDIITIPANFGITNITVKKIGTTAGNIKIGTAPAGDQVVTAVALSGTDGNVSDLTSKIDFFVAETPLYVGVDSVATGILSIQIHKII